MLVGAARVAQVQVATRSEIQVVPGRQRAAARAAMPATEVKTEIQAMQQVAQAAVLVLRAIRTGVEEMALQGW